MKHIIGITLVDPTDKQYSTVRTYRGMEYEEGEIDHEVAWKKLEDGAFHQQNAALKRAGVDIKAVNAKFKPSTSTGECEGNLITFTTADKVAKQPAITNGWTAGQNRQESISMEELRVRVIEIYKKLHIKSSFDLGGWTYWLGEKGERAYRKPLKEM